MVLGLCLFSRATHDPAIEAATGARGCIEHISSSSSSSSSSTQTEHCGISVYLALSVRIELELISIQNQSPYAQKPLLVTLLDFHTPKYEETGWL
jgi:hypothetical protein